MGRNTEKTYLVEIDYSQSLQKMIDAGRYEWVNPNITQKNFPIESGGFGEVELFLVHLNRRTTIKEVENEIKERGLQVGKIPRLLALGAQYPDLQRQFPIVSLGSVWVRPDGHHYVPYLNEHWRGPRYLDLRWDESSWFGRWRFLAARA